MSLAEIQRAVDTLSADERVRLTAWMVSHYPLLTVEQLMAHAKSLVEKGEWEPTPPTSDNTPRGEVLDRAIQTARELGFDQ